MGLTKIHKQKKKTRLAVGALSVAVLLIPLQGSVDEQG